MMEKKFTTEMVDMYAEKLLIGLTPEENKMVLDDFEKTDADIVSKGDFYLPIVLHR